MFRALCAYPPLYTILSFTKTLLYGWSRRETEAKGDDRGGIDTSPSHSTTSAEAIINIKPRLHRAKVVLFAEYLAEGSAFINTIDMELLNKDKTHA